MMFITMMMMTTMTRLMTMMMMMIKIAITMIMLLMKKENDNGEVHDDCQRQDDHNAFTQSITPNKLAKDQRPL